MNCAFSICWNTWFAPPTPAADEEEPVASRQRGGTPPPHQPQSASWHQALRVVRGWLTPWTTLQRYWRAWSTKPPPAVLQELINSIASGRPLDLYRPG
ncbi:hypothetical protein OHA74_14645 [Streptomyces phaeochromogenes]|nr:hypothetical protein [Streptomyces phaeochromogenes]